MQNAHHRYHSFFHRGFYALLLAAGVLAIGTFGLHAIEGFSYIDSFYFASLIATGQGPAPNAEPHTTFGKLFTAFFAFISTGTMVATLGFIFGPFLGKLLHIGILKLEEELHIKKHPSKKA